MANENNDGQTQHSPQTQNGNPRRQTNNQSQRQDRPSPNRRGGENSDPRAAHRKEQAEALKRFDFADFIDKNAYAVSQLWRLISNPRQSVVVTQSSGETRALVSSAIDLDRRFALIRENMFGALPGEYGALALQDAQEAIQTLLDVEGRINALGISKSVYESYIKRHRIDRLPFKAENVERYRWRKIAAFITNGERLAETLKALNIDAQAVSQTLKEALSDYEAKLKTEQEAKIAKEEAERAERARLKAERRAEWEARQKSPSQEIVPDEQNETKSNGVLASLMETTETKEIEPETKPSKSKKEKAA
jgi:hypothetical protein